MKLRNRKTGDAVNGAIILKTYDHDEPWYFDSIAELVEHWEDCKGPLIKDEKIRKAVRAWAEANEIETVDYDKYWVAFGRDDKTISFKDYDKCLGFYGLDDNATYTIAELCGEEEE